MLKNLLRNVELIKSNPSMRKLPRNTYPLTSKMGILKKGEQKSDKELLPATGILESDVELSKEFVSSLPLSVRTKRDIAIDYGNPEELMASYTASEDENPPFDWSTLTMIAPGDEIAKQAVSSLQRAAVNFRKEDTKYDQGLPENIGGDVDDETSAEMRKFIEDNINMQRQQSLDQTASL